MKKVNAFVTVNELFKLFHFLNNSSKSHWTLQYIVQSVIKFQVITSNGKYQSNYNNDKLLKKKFSFVFTNNT